MTSAPLLAMLLAQAARAGTLRLAAYGPDGKPMSQAQLLLYVSPFGSSEATARRKAGGLLLTDPDGIPAAGRPWWVERSTEPAWSWDGPARVRASFPWPIAKDGFSTVEMDAGGSGYADGQRVLLNEEIALTEWRMLQESLKERASLWAPPYSPGRRAQGLIEEARLALAKAKEVQDERGRAREYDEALRAVSYAWQHVLFDHGRQVSEHPKLGAGIRWGLTLDESLPDRVAEFDWLADRLREAQVNWVRIVFRTNSTDFTYAQARSFTIYDEAVARLAERKIRVMGSVLDSLLWPKGVTPALYAERAANLAWHFKERIRSWEVASEPNGTWLGGARDPMAPEAVLDCVLEGAARLKKVDSGIETVATLHWWEGTAGDDRHPVIPWSRWAIARGFGKDFDVIGLSFYPHRHPVGIAFDPAFSRLRRLFPGQRMMLGGFSFLEDKKFSGYWWLEPESVEEARKDALALYTGAACAIPQTLGGGFWWTTLSQMLPTERRTSALYRVYKNTRKRLER